MLALHEASLEIYPAEIVALVGSNGAGKTTLLRALSRVIRSTGSISFDGREHRRPHARRGRSASVWSRCPRAASSSIA